MAMNKQSKTSKKALIGDLGSLTMTKEEAEKSLKEYQAKEYRRAKALREKPTASE